MVLNGQRKTVKKNVKVRLLLCRSLTSKMQRRKENLKMVREEPREAMQEAMTSSGTPGGLEETGQGKEQGRSPQERASHLSRGAA